MPGDETVTRRQGPSWTMWLTLFSALGIILGFVALEMWRGLGKLEAENAALGEKMNDLEADQSKWGTLAEIENRLRAAEVELEVTQRVFEYEFGRKIPTPRRERKPSLQAPPPIPPRVVQQVDPEAYQRIQRGKFPPLKK